MKTESRASTPCTVFRRLLAGLLIAGMVACTETEVILPEESMPVPPPAPAGITDSDNDGLSDEREAEFGTSPIMADSDGDGFDDNEEITNGGTHPLIADVPSFSIDVTGSPSIQIDTTYESNREVAQGYNASLSQGRESSYSRSDSNSTTNTTENSDRVYGEVEGSCNLGGCGGSAKVGAETTTTATNTSEKSTTVTSASAQSSREEYGRYIDESRDQRVVEESGSLRATLKITNTSSRSFRIHNIDVIAKNHAAGGRRLETIDELLLAPEGGRDLVPGASIEQFIIGNGTSLPKLKELMQNPSGLLFTVGSVAIEDVSGGDPDKDYAEISQAVFNRTARVVIDFGDQDGGRSGAVETYLVATNVARDPVTLEPLGVTLREVLEDILEIPYETGLRPVLDENAAPTGEQHRVLTAVRSVASRSVEEGVWYVYSDSKSLDSPTADFGDIVLTDDNYVNLVYLADADGDRLFNREEQLHGSNMRNADTDADMLDDNVEIKEGWIARSGFREYRVYADPLSADADGDGLADVDERREMTDPNVADTDGDGINDLEDTDKTGGISGVSFMLDLVGPGNEVLLKGSVASSDVLDGVAIDWGDGSQPQPLASFDNISTRHQYASKGEYVVTITADRPFGADPTKQFRVTLLPESRDNIGGMTFADGWTEQVDKRQIADVNGDGRVDLVGFGVDGVSVALARSDSAMPGFDSAANVLAAFSSGAAGFGQHIHLLDNVGGGPEPEIVVFADDGVQVAINTGGEFSEPEAWVGDYGADEGFLPDVHPRMLDDVNRDGYADVVGFLDDGVYLSYSYGVGFDAALKVYDGYGTSDAWSANNPRMLADANGDGYPDIFAFGGQRTYVTLNSLSPAVNGDAAFAGPTNSVARWSDDQSYLVDRHIRLAVNVTGADGTADVVAFANSVTAGNRLRPDGTFESTAYNLSTDFSVADDWTIPDHDRYVVDVTGDGNPEIVGFKDNAVLFALNSGDNGRFERERSWPGAASLFGNDWDGRSNPRFVGDVNGDGVADLIGVGDNEVIVEYSALIESL